MVAFSHSLTLFTSLHHLARRLPNNEKRKCERGGVSVRKNVKRERKITYEKFISGHAKWEHPDASNLSMASSVMHVLFRFIYMFTVRYDEVFITLK